MEAARINARVVLGIALSRWSFAHRQALCLLHMGRASTIDDFVPAIWNRLAKAKEAIRELEKAQHLTRDAGRLLLLESSFTHDLPQTQSGPEQMAFPEAPGLGVALAEVSRVDRPVLDRTDGPSQDGQVVLSGTGPPASALPAKVSAWSGPGQDRSSISIENNKIDRFDDRGGPGQDSGVHQDFVFEMLAKDPRLGHLRAELNRRKTPTAHRFWMLFDKRAYRAAALIKYVSTRKNPQACLNACLQKETM